ncbi:MAG: prolyl oligopeptidase family serine peptidase [Rubrivivax sp.]
MTRTTEAASATATPAVTPTAPAAPPPWAAPSRPPAAPSVPVTDTHHGVAVPDPFRNLEDLKAPATRAWLQAQGEHAAGVLARIAVRDPLQARITALSATTGDRVSAITRRPGGRLFYLLRPAGAGQFKLVVREGLQGPVRVLVDPQQLTQATGVPHAINYFTPSWDGRTVAYGVSAGGSEQASLHLMDVASGRQLRAPVPRVNEERLGWSPDNRYLAFNQMRDLAPGTDERETYLDSTVMLLDRQQPAHAPRPFFGPLVNRALKLDRLDFATVAFAPGSRHMLARTTDTTSPEGKWFVAPLTALPAAYAGRPVRWQAVAMPEDAVTEAQMRGDTLFLRSHRDAPRGRVLAVPLARPQLAQARVVVPEPQQGVLESFELGQQALYTSHRQGFALRVLRHDVQSPGAGVDVAPQLPGSTYALLEEGGPDNALWLATSTWTEPSRVLARGADGHFSDTGLRRNPLPAGVPEIEVREVLVPSHDGVPVPLAVLHRKGLVLDGSAPTLLDGYGAYGLTTQAYYDARRFAWLERGGVLAYVNPRGSGADGRAWHLAGFKTTKPNTWKDGIAAARWLVAQGYTRPERLAVEGTSAGGIFVGRAVTSEPALFAAAIFNVGQLDAVRGETTANGVTNISEFGTVAQPDEFRALLAMSTYHQVQDGVAYPGVLLIHGLNDPRVEPWHSAKAAARLQQASTSGRPVLLRLDGQAGHGMGSTAQQAAGQLADSYAFLLWQFGMAPLTGAKP